MEIILALLLGLLILPASNANAGIVAASDGLTTINVTLGQITGTASVDGLTDTSSMTVKGSLTVEGTGGVSILGPISATGSGNTMSGPLTVASSVTVTGNAFSVGGSTLVVSGGRVGVGATSSAYNLYVKPPSGDGAGGISGATGGGTALLGLTDTNSTTTWLLYSGYPAAGDFTLRESGVLNAIIAKKTTGEVQIPGSAFSVGGSTLVVSGGKVGVGTASPSTILSVSTSTNNAPSLTADNGIFEIVQSLTGSELQMGLSPTSPYPAWIQTKQPNNAGGTWPLALNPLGGNVGIGDQSPSEKLEVAGGIASYPRTMAQLLAITPSQVGVQYFCNNCSPAKMVVSTGTAAGNFADIMGGTFE